MLHLEARGLLRASKKTHRLVLIGPPGAGKGTQAARLRRDHSLAHISTGDMLRDEVRRGTSLGLAAQGLIQQGRLVSDEVILGMVESRLLDLGGGFILDGFPRSRRQAEALVELLTNLRLPLTGVIELALADEVIVERLSLRRICPSCGQSYHLSSHPPAQPGLCDHDGQRLLQREDDCESVIRNRLRVYHEQTAPVVEFFRERGLLTRLDAGQPIARVEQQVELSLV